MQPHSKSGISSTIDLGNSSCRFSPALNSYRHLETKNGESLLPQEKSIVVLLNSSSAQIAGRCLRAGQKIPKDSLKFLFDRPTFALFPP